MAQPTAGPLALALAFILGLTLTTTPAPASPPRLGAPGMSGPGTGPLLVDYFDAFLRDHDVESFRQHVLSRYSEATLARLAVARDVQARRAAVLALGLVGTFASNAAVAGALKDADSTVRDLAGHALWAIWFRADTPENNATLARVRDLIGRADLDEAAALADRLIARAPDFAEAYNQRAIAHFFRGRFAESAADCRRVLERNPYHIGALGGLGKCQLQLDRRAEARQTFRRALDLQPYDEGLRQLVAALEAGE